MVTADLEMVADQIKRFFNEAKREQMGKPYRPAERYRRPEFWLKAAETCIEVGADPYSFVRGAFLYNSVPGGPFPQHMASRAAVRWYLDYRRMYEKAVEKHPGMPVFECEMRSVFQDLMLRYFATRPLRTIREFLSSETLSQSIPAFVRCVMLPSDAQMWARFATDARLEILSNPQLLKTLPKLGVSEELLLRIRDGNFNHGHNASSAPYADIDRHLSPKL